MCINFKVAWFGTNERLTWEPASALPRFLIEEFEKGCPELKFETVTNKSFGVINHTLVVTESVSGPPPAKYPKFSSASGARYVTSLYYRKHNYNLMH